MLTKEEKEKQEREAEAWVRRMCAKYNVPENVVDWLLYETMGEQPDASIEDILAVVENKLKHGYYVEP